MTLEGRQIDVQRELDQLRAEVEERGASRRRLVLAADADRRSIERELHDGVHQHLVAVAVGLQLARQTAGSDPAAAQMLLEEVGHDVQKALDEAGRLAQRIHPTTLEASDLAALLRTIATNAGVLAAVDVSAHQECPSEVVMTIHVCWLDTLTHTDGEKRVTIDVHDDVDALTFEIVGHVTRPEADLGGLRDRVEALGGTLTSTSIRGGGTRVSGSLPLAQ